MKLCIVFACMLGLALAGDEVQVLRNEAEVNPESFRYAYELDNSVKADQQGELQGDFNWIVNGQYSYISPEGESIALAYTADENGYHPDLSNPLIPTSPPIPEAIQRSLEYLAAHPPPTKESSE